MRAAEGVSASEANSGSSPCCSTGKPSREYQFSSQPDPCGPEPGSGSPVSLVSPTSPNSSSVGGKLSLEQPKQAATPKNTAPRPVGFMKFCYQRCNQQSSGWHLVQGTTTDPTTAAKATPQSHAQDGARPSAAHQSGARSRRVFGQPLVPPTGKVRHQDFGAEVQFGLISDAPAARSAAAMLGSACRGSARRSDALAREDILVARQSSGRIAHAGQSITTATPPRRTLPRSRARGDRPPG